MVRMKTLLRQTCSARKLATYRSRSNVHAYLAETALSRAVPAPRSQ